MPSVPDSEGALVISDLMIKLRCCQVVGIRLYNAGAFDRSKEVFLKTIDQCMSDDYVKFVPDKMLKVLRGSSALTAKAGVSARDAAFMLRRSVDILYDHFMNKFCVGVDFYQTRLAMQDVGELLNNAMFLMKDERFEEARRIYTDISNDLLKNWQHILSHESRSMLSSGLADAEKAPSSEYACQTLRKCTEHSYNETRVPEEYVNTESLSCAPVESDAVSLYEEVVLVDFTDRFVADDWEVRPFSDQSINGESTCYFVAPTSDRRFALWYGSVSTVNYGGYASFKMIPKLPSVTKISKMTVGVKIWARNNSNTNSCFKMALYPKAEGRFHWDSDFKLSLNESFQAVFLPIKSFWPTIFGHSLGLPAKNGNVDGISVFGMVIGRTLASGKPNVDFREGEYSLAVEKIVLVNLRDPKNMSAAQNADSA